MATPKPHTQKTLEDKRSISKGFDLGAITDPIANLFNQYSTVQVKNGSQGLLLVRGEEPGSDPVTPLQTGKGGVVSIANTQKALQDQKAAAAIKKSKGIWSGLPTAAKAGIIAGGAGLVLVGIAFVALRH